MRVRIHALNLVLITGTCTAQQLREERNLGGTWETQVTKSVATRVPQDGWKAGQAPSVRSSLAKGGSQFVWYRRSVSIPGGWTGKRVLLHLSGARFHPHVFLDGKLIGDRLEGWTPFEVELTGPVTPGESHELAVRCQDWGATFTEGYVLPTTVSGDPRRDVRECVLAPIGGHYRQYGIWDDVKLVARPNAYLDDVAIVTSVRKNTLTVRGGHSSVASRGLKFPASDLKLGMTVGAQVLSGTEVVLELPRSTVGAAARWEVSARWLKARRWSPEDPHLYRLRLTLRDAGGEVIDVRDERFGFRELWAEGPDFYLNGVKRHLLATSTWPAPEPLPRKEIRKILEVIKAGNNIAFRMHTQPWQKAYLEEADEVGVMMIEEASLWTVSCFAYKDARFWQNYKDHVAGMIRRDRNHASLVMWSMENELLHCGAQRVDPKSEDKLADVGLFAKAFDPHHLITFESDHDPGGVADVVGLHYPHEMPENADYPNTADWLARTVVTGTAGGIGGTWNKKFRWDRKKPLYIGEFLWIPVDDYAPGTVFYGDEAYTDHGRYKLMAKADSWVHQVLAYRRAGVSGMCPWTCTGRGGAVEPRRRLLYETQKRVYEPIAAFVREHDSRFFAADTVTRTVDVFNDSAQAQGLVLQWQLGKARGRRELRLEPGGHEVVQLEAAVPPASTKLELDFRTELHADGKLVHQQVRTCSVWPRCPVSAPKGRELVVFDPKGKLEGIAARKLHSLDALRSVDVSRVVCLVGPGALVAPAEIDVPVVGAEVGGTAGLAAFLRKGGLALILEQETLVGLPVDVALVSHGSTMAFPVALGHPMLEGLSEADFRFWRRGHYVSRREMRRPTRGGGRMLLVSGGDQSVAQGPLLEAPVGRGTMVLCQALVGEKMGHEPAARQLFQNALNYLASVAPRESKTLLLSESDAFADRLELLGLAFERVVGVLTEQQTRGCDVLMLHGGGETISASTTPIRAFAASGGRRRAFYWHAPDPTTFAKIRDAIGCAGMEIVPANGPLVMRDRQHELLRGVCREDLVYVGKPRGRTWMRGFEPDPRVVDRALLPAARDRAGAERFEAERMTIEGKITRVDENGAYFATAGRATVKVRIAEAGTYRVTVHAGGTQAAGVYPVVAIQIAGKAIARIALMQGETRAYVAMADLPAGEHELGVAFVNDAQVGDEDRNLFLDAVLIDREPMPASEVELLTLPTSLATRMVDGVRIVIDGVRWDTNERNRTKGCRYASTLFGNLGCSFEQAEGNVAWITARSFEPVGTIPYFRKTKTEVSLVAAGTVRAEFKCARAGRYRVFVRGRSQPALDEFGKALVQVDGKAVCELELAATAVNVFRGAVVRLDAGAHEVTVEFTNDLWRDGQDRNLYVSAVGFAAAE